MRFRWGKVPAFYLDEAVRDACFWKAEADKYRAQANRLLAVNKQTERELGEELYRLQRDLAWTMDANACLALEISEKDFELAQMRGEA